MRAFSRKIFLCGEVALYTIWFIESLASSACINDIVHILENRPYIDRHEIDIASTTKVFPHSPFYS